MITVTKTEIDVQDIRELAAAYRDIAEGYGSAKGNHCAPPDMFYESALSLLKLVDIKVVANEQPGNRVPVSTPT